VDEAERVYGKDGPEYLKALTEWRVAEATAAEAQAKADEARAQYEVYALDPSYGNAQGAAAHE
jgi:hypothetical protein